MVYGASRNRTPNSSARETEEQRRTKELMGVRWRTLENQEDALGEEYLHRMRRRKSGWTWYIILGVIGLVVGYFVVLGGIEFVNVLNGEKWPHERPTREERRQQAELQRLADEARAREAQRAELYRKTNEEIFCRRVSYFRKSVAEKKEKYTAYGKNVLVHSDLFGASLNARSIAELEVTRDKETYLRVAKLFKEASDTINAKPISEETKKEIEMLDTTFAADFKRCGLIP